MGPMEKSYYLISWRPAFFNLLKSLGHESVAAFEQTQIERLLVAISQGGFGQDVIDNATQVKERFLAVVCDDYDLELPRDVATFDQYFELIEPDFFIDLDEA
jgi:hypothetical protein